MDNQEDEFTNQALELILQNTTLRRKVQPILLGGVVFNFIILVLLLFIIWRLRNIDN